MFVPATLAARIELVEARLSLAVAATAETDPIFSSHITEIGGGASVFVRPAHLRARLRASDRQPAPRVTACGPARPRGSVPPG